MLLLDGVVQILETFTDYEQLVVSLPAQHEIFVSPSLSLVMSVLSAIPVDLVKRCYLPQLATWLAALPVQREGPGSVDGTGWVDCTGSVDDQSKQQKLRMEMYRRRIAAYVEGKNEHTGTADRDRGKLAGDIAEGRSLSVLGLVLSEDFKHENDCYQVGVPMPLATSSILLVHKIVPYARFSMLDAVTNLFGLRCNPVLYATISSGTLTRAVAARQDTRKVLERSLH